MADENTTKGDHVMNKQTQQMPLIELLKAVPKTALLIVDSADGISSTVHPVGYLCHKAAKALEQPAQEPVGFVVTAKLGEHCSFKSTTVRKGDKVYTHPHQWQGLTDDEIDALEHNDFTCWGRDDLIVFARAIEQELKTKNGFSEIKEKNYD